MLLLMLIPTMMTAVGVVREKEVGSIVNLYVTPVTRLEFLLGKQLPYVGLALVNFATMALLGVFVMGVPIKGSLAGLLTGAALYAGAATGFGLLVSSFVRSQVAAIFATGVLSAVPAVEFSGMYTPVSSLSGGGRAMGALFPSTYFSNDRGREHHQGSGLPRPDPFSVCLGGLHRRLLRLHPRAAPKAGGLTVWNSVANVYRLGVKELYGVRYDLVLLWLIAYTFTFSVYLPAKDARMELVNASVAVADEDRSDLSRRIIAALRRPFVRTPGRLSVEEIDPATDVGQYTFVLDIPPHFQADVLRRRSTAVQLIVDATAMSQAGAGVRYIQNAAIQELTNFNGGRRPARR